MSHLMTSLFPMHAAVAMELKAKAEMAKAESRNSAWHTDLPDDEVTVLVRRDDEELPLSVGYHDDGDWYHNNGERMLFNVTGWMHLEDACKVLDGGVQ